MPKTSSLASKRAVETRARLIDAALDLFGTLGFAATTTRQLAERAQVNLAAIPYHFGSKEKLYAAAAVHIVDEVGVHLRAFEAAATGLNTPQAARETLHLIFDRLLEKLTAPVSERWARIIIREQMTPTPIFHILYDGFIGPVQERLSRLLAAALGQDPETPELKARALALFGQALVFRAAHATTLRRLGAETIGPKELATIKRALRLNLDAILDAEGRT